MNPVDEYLARLDSALAGVPRAQRDEIVDEITGHIAAATAELPPGDEAALRTMLDQLGDPEEIAADARPERIATRRGWHEIAAIALLLVGGFFFGVGWLVGVVLLWTSNAWNTRDKLIGTFVVPGGLALVLYVAVLAGSGSGTICLGTADGKQLCKTTHGTPLLQQVAWGVALVALLILPVLTAVYLARRSRPAPA